MSDIRRLTGRHDQAQALHLTHVSDYIQQWDDVCLLLGADIITGKSDDGGSVRRPGARDFDEHSSVVVKLPDGRESRLGEWLVRTVYGEVSLMTSEELREVYG